MCKKIIYTLHRVLGTVVSLLFLMWFITGLVLIYHSFPDVSKQLKNEKRFSITDSIPYSNALIDSVFKNEVIKKIQLNTYFDQAALSIETKNKTLLLDKNLNSLTPHLSRDEILNIANTWVDTPITQIDTLHKRDVWIMYTKYLKELPIYKVHFDDKEKHQLYLSSKTGEVQQFTSRSERFWAYLGSIPHKLYIPALRQHTGVWINTLTVLATICFITVLSGIIIGIRALIKRHKNKNKWGSAYLKKSYKWHHLFGLFFGLFLLTWSISGMMALQKTPQWLVKTQKNYPIASKIRGKDIQPTDFKLDLRSILSSNQEVKQINWMYFHNTPYYEVVIQDSIHYIDASQESITPLNLSKENITQTIVAIHGDSVAFSIDWLEDYDEYYLQWKRELPLPVYRIIVNSQDQNRYYISPNTGYYKHIDKNRMARKWLFNATHYMHMKRLTDYPIIWSIVIWTLALGCIVVCGTGVWLSVACIKRNFKSKTKNK